MSSNTDTNINPRPINPMEIAREKYYRIIKEDYSSRLLEFQKRNNMNDLLVPKLDIKLLETERHFQYFWYIFTLNYEKRYPGVDRPMLEKVIEDEDFVIHNIEIIRVHHPNGLEVDGLEEVERLMEIRKAKQKKELADGLENSNEGEDNSEESLEGSKTPKRDPTKEYIPPKIPIKKGFELLEKFNSITFPKPDPPSQEVVSQAINNAKQFRHKRQLLIETANINGSEEQEHLNNLGTQFIAVQTQELNDLQQQQQYHYNLMVRQQHYAMMTQNNQNQLLNQQFQSMYGQPINQAYSAYFQPQVPMIQYPNQGYYRMNVNPIMNMNLNMNQNYNFNMNHNFANQMTFQPNTIGVNFMNSSGYANQNNQSSNLAHSNPYRQPMNFMIQSQPTYQANIDPSIINPNNINNFHLNTNMNIDNSTQQYITSQLPQQFNNTSINLNNGYYNTGNNLDGSQMNFDRNKGYFSSMNSTLNPNAPTFMPNQ